MKRSPEIELEEVTQESHGVGLDVERLKRLPQEQVAEYTTYFSREVRKAGNQERVNPIFTSFAEMAKLTNPDSRLSTTIATNKVYAWAKDAAVAFTIDTTPSLTEEAKKREALEAINDLINYPPESIMIWISAKGETALGESLYKSVRINVYWRVKINNEDYIFSLSIPSQHSDQECLACAKKFAPCVCNQKNIYWQDDVEALRITPLEVNVPENTDTISFLADCVDLPEVWPKIADGTIIKEAIAELEIGEKELITPKIYQAIVNARTRKEQIIAGRMLEERARQVFGIELLAEEHGGLNSDVQLQQLGLSYILAGCQSSEISVSGEYEHCGACKEHKAGEKYDTSNGPPKCGHAIKKNK